MSRDKAKREHRSNKDRTSMATVLIQLGLMVVLAIRGDWFAVAGFGIATVWLLRWALEVSMLVKRLDEQETPALFNFVVENPEDITDERVQSALIQFKAVLDESLGGDNVKVVSMEKEADEGRE